MQASQERTEKKNLYVKETTEQKEKAYN